MEEMRQGWCVFARSSALATSVILLTLLPVARHGRLAMLDGTQLTAMALLL